PRAAAARRFSLRVGPPRLALSLGGSAPRSGRRRLAFLTARGAPPPRALARRLRAALGPQALGISHCAWGPTATRSRSAASRRARAAGAWHFSLRVGPHRHALSLGGFAPRSGRRPLAFLPPPAA